MTPEQYASLAAGEYRRIPISLEILADFETPLSAYRKLGTGPYSYLLESVQGGEKWGRYSIIGLPSSRLIKVFGFRVELWNEGELSSAQEVADPLAYLEAFQQEYHTPEITGLPVFHGGLVGYFGYDTVRYAEPCLRASVPEKDELGLPDILLMVSEQVLVFDNLSGTLQLVVHVDPSVAGAYERAQQRLDQLAGQLRRPLAAPRPLDLTAATIGRAQQVIPKAEVQSSCTAREYYVGVDRIKEYILAGDVMQVVPSQRFSLPFREAPLDLYRALRNLNPSPYMYYLDLQDFHIVGSSPEILVRLERGVVTVRPIAGTRPRGQDEAEDLAMEQELLADPKEIAEHLMLIDLGRNDVGRIAQTGTVKLTENMVVERYSHVMHIVSNVTGRLREDQSAIDVLRATLPAGTLSGAPKIRAMQIIDELETVKRGVYGGAIGYLSWRGDMDTAIAIRTAVIKDEVLHIQAGGGVVADSIPAMEYQESLNKARALFRAAAMVQVTDE
ncbi:MAG: anthranilate synthase component I [Halieaceae bacterium]|nr:anthranilate synthase component I [Halieaceae bacterium]